MMPKQIKETLRADGVQPDDVDALIFETRSGVSHVVVEFTNETEAVFGWTPVPDQPELRNWHRIETAEAEVKETAAA